VIEVAAFGGAVVAGLVGSGHCAAMCGPFAAWAGAPDRRPVRSTTAYQVGRLLTYLSIGVVAGVAGQAFGDVASLGAARGVAAVVAALVLLVAGISQLWPRKPSSRPSLTGRVVGALVKLAGDAGPVGGPLLLGAAAGLLPCGMLWAFALAAAATLDIGASVGVMAGLWLGSLPALVAVAAAAGWLRGKVALHGRKAVGWALIALAVFSLVQRWPEPEKPAASCPHQAR